MIYMGLLVSIFLEYFRPTTYLPLIGALKLNVLIPVGTFALCFLATRNRPSNGAVLTEANGLWLMFFLSLIVLALFTADVTLYAYNTLSGVVGYFLLFFVVSKELTSESRIRGFMLLLIATHFALVVLNPNVILEPQTRSYIRGVTFLGDGNDFALSLCILLPWCLYLARSAEGKLLRWTGAGCGVLLLLAIIGTQSRGATLALIAMSLYLWSRSRRKVLGLVIMLFAVVVVGVIATDQYLNRVESIAEYQDDGSAMNRLKAWNAAIRMAADNPLVGAGAGHFPRAYGTEYRPPGVGRTQLAWHTAHSMYFLALGELGVPGMIFVLGFLWTNYRKNNRILKAGQELARDDPEAERVRWLFLALNCSLVGFGVAGAFLSVLYYPHLFVIGGLLAAARRECSGFLSETAAAPAIAESQPAEQGAGVEMPRR